MKTNSDQNVRAHPKDRILQAGIKLFSHKGFAASGVRELAETAGVNLSMISYYYGSKMGVLKSIIDRFFTEYSSQIRESFGTSGSIETKICSVVRAVTEYLRANTKLMMIVVAHMPLDVPEVFQYKAEHLKQLKRIAAENLVPLIAESGQKVPPPEMIGPIMGGMLMGHFIFRPVIEALGDVVLDDDYYEFHIQLLSRTLIHGIIGERSADGLHQKGSLK
jgi:AcrR family transcriptional regulator